jgi:hypothetical protein
MDRDPGDQRRALLRASDADREQFVEALRRHQAEGRLTSLIWYGLLSAVLLVVWVMSGRDYFWPIWPILGFALFIGWQAFNVFGPQDPDRAHRRGRDR